MSKKSSNARSVTRSNNSRQTLQAAIHALQMQRPDEAARIASGVAAFDKDNILALQIWGHALLLQNRPAEALVPLKSAAHKSDDPAIATLYATALAGSGRRDDALDQLRRTTATRPLYPPACLEYSAQLTRADRFDEATAVLVSGVAAAPDSAELRMELGFHHLKRNARAKARASFEEVLAMTPDRIDAVTALAKVMAMDGDYQAAIKTYRHVLARQPHDVMTRNNLAICELETGNRHAGEASLREAVRLVPQLAGQAITALSSASHGRFFLRPSAAAAFLRSEAEQTQPERS